MMSRSAPLALFLLSGFCSSLCADEGPADDRPLHQQIDELIRTAEFGPVAEQADDATFIRRICLDLIGRIPTRDEVESFLADETPDKRARLVDQLLAGPQHDRHLAIVFDVMLMERRGGKHVGSPEFRRFLEQAFSEDRSYLELVRDMLAADGTDEKHRAAAAFYLEREVEPHLLTRDVGRMFYGMDLQCAQCHDHPLIDDYHQQDYYGLHAFFVRSSLFQPDKKKPALIAETATGEASFASVFTAREGMIGPRVPAGEELPIQTLKPSEQYEVAPAKNVRPVPTRSRRELLSDHVAASPTPAFSRNIANRLWAHMFGRGLVHPVDLHHSGNPATYPAVLELLATRFADADYQVSSLLRELALTEVYQRSIQLPPLEPSIEDARRRIDAATAAAEAASKQAMDADEQVTALIEKLDAAVAEAKPLRQAESEALKAAAAAVKARDEAQAKVTAREQAIAGQTQNTKLLNESLQATRAVVESLKDDKDLATALATIQQRATTYESDLKKQQEALATEQAALAKAEQTHAQGAAAADEAIAARQPFEQTVRTLRSELFTAREKAQQLWTAASIARRDVDYLETLVAYGTTQQQATALADTLAQQQQSLAEHTKAVTAAKQQLAMAAAEVEAARIAVASEDTRLATSREQLAAAQRTRSELQAAITSTESAASRLADAANLTEAVALLKQTVPAADASVTEAQAAVETQQAMVETVTARLTAAEAVMQTARQDHDRLQAEAAELKAQLTKSQQALTDTRANLNAHWESVVDQSAARGNATAITPLTPEQLALSTLIATGQYDRLRAAAEKKIAESMPLTEEQANDPAAVAKRDNEVEKAFRESLNGAVGTFVRLYGAGAGQPQQEFFATAEQSLFLANGSELRSWLQPSNGNLTERLLNETDPAALARDLYVTVLSRPPAPEEAADVAGYLASRPDDKRDALQELAWGLLTSAEFRFRH